METWQLVLFAFLVLLPFALMLDFWPERERTGYNGKPLERAWRRQIDHQPPEDAHH